MNWRQAALAAAGAIAISAQTAGADGWRLALPMTATTVNDAFARSPFYGGLSYEHQWRGYGRFQFGTVGVLGTGTSPLFDRWVHGESKQPGFHVGMRLPDAWAPPWAGRNLRVEFSGAGSLFSDRQERRFPRVNSTFFTVGTGVPLNTGGTSGTDFQANVHSIEGALRVASDFEVAPGLTLTPAFAILGGASHSRYRLVMLDICQNATAPCFQTRSRSASGRKNTAAPSRSVPATIPISEYRCTLAAGFRSFTRTQP